METAKNPNCCNNLCDMSKFVVVILAAAVLIGWALSSPNPREKYHSMAQIKAQEAAETAFLRENAGFFMVEKQGSALGVSYQSWSVAAGFVAILLGIGSVSYLGLAVVGRGKASF